MGVGMFLLQDANVAGAGELDIRFHGRAVLVQVYRAVLLDFASEGVLLGYGGAGDGVDGLGLLRPLGAVVYGAVAGQGEAGGPMGGREAGSRADGLVFRSEAEKLLALIVAAAELTAQQLCARVHDLGGDAVADGRLAVGFSIGAVGYGLGALVGVVVVVHIDEALTGDALLHVVVDVDYWDPYHYLDLELFAAEGAYVPVENAPRCGRGAGGDRDHLHSIG